MPYKTGSFDEHLEAWRKLPPQLRELVDSAPAFINCVQVFDCLQKRGLETTLRIIKEDIEAALYNRKADEKLVVYKCGHTHSSHFEAQHCPTWLAILRGEKPIVKPEYLA